MDRTTLHSFDCSNSHAYVQPVDGGFRVVVRDAEDYHVNEDTGQFWPIAAEVDRVVATERHAYLIAKFGIRKLAGPWCQDEIRYFDESDVREFWARYDDSELECPF